MSADLSTDLGANGDVDEPIDSQSRIRALEAENERLRTALETARRRRYRRTAVGMAAVGATALVGAALFAELRTVLVALGGTGVFAAVLTYFLTPERFVAASVGESIYRTLADNERAIVDDLDLRGDPVVVPAAGSAAPARLFVPLTAGGDTPDDGALLAPFVTDGASGVALAPTGGPLYESLSDAAGGLPDDPGGLAATVGDALVEQFELVDGVDTDVDGTANRATMSIDGSAYGPVDRFDHPVASLLATTLAAELDSAVAWSVDRGGSSADWLVTCRWEPR